MSKRIAVLSSITVSVIAFAVLIISLQPLFDHVEGVIDGLIASGRYDERYLTDGWQYDYSTVHVFGAASIAYIVCNAVCMAVSIFSEAESGSLNLRKIFVASSVAYALALAVCFVLISISVLGTVMFGGIIAGLALIGLFLAGTLIVNRHEKKREPKRQYTVRIYC